MKQKTIKKILKTSPYILMAAVLTFAITSLVAVWGYKDYPIFEIAFTEVILFGFIWFFLDVLEKYYLDREDVDEHQT